MRVSFPIELQADRREVYGAVGCHAGNGDTERRSAFRAAVREFGRKSRPTPKDTEPIVVCMLSGFCAKHLDFFVHSTAKG